MDEPDLGVRYARLVKRADALGRYAEWPTQITLRGWARVIRRTAKEIVSDRVSLTAAGCAFYATLALFPAITMLLFIYGLAFDPKTIEPQLQVVAELLPPSAYLLISERIHSLIANPPHTLGIGLFISLVVTLWSSATGTKSMLAALNLAYETKETRGFVRFQLTAFAITLCGLVGAAVAIATLVAMPALFSALGMAVYQQTMIRIVSTLVLVLFLMAALSFLYRVGPARPEAHWHWITPGSIVATLLWLAASALFSFYVARLASYDLTYGPIGAVVGVMMWFYVTVYAVLLGAELNAELERLTGRHRQAARPTT